MSDDPGANPGLVDPDTAAANAPPAFSPLSEDGRIGIALVVLLLTFGSAIAAGMPIITAIFGVALGMTGGTAMTAVTDIGSSTPPASRSVRGARRSSSPA